MIGEQMHRQDCGPLQRARCDGPLQWLTFTVAWMVTAALLLLAIRLPLGRSSHSISVSDVAHFLLFGTALLAAFPLGRVLGETRERPDEARAVAAIATVLIAAAWVWITLAAGREVPWLVTGIGFVLLASGLAALRSGCRKWGREGLTVMAVAGVALAVFHQFVLVRKGYSHPWAFELALAGLQHKDTLFHAAIAGSLLSHGVPSIGIDGDPVIHYHFASHFLIGHLGAWTHLVPLQAYSVFMPVIGVPLLFGMLLCAGDAVAGRISSSHGRELPVWSRQLLLLAAAVLSIRMDLGSLLVSESYAVSLACMLAGIYFTNDTRLASRLWTVAACLLIAVLVASTSMSKISTGAVMACGIAAWLALGSGRPTVMSMVSGAVFGLLPFLAVYAAIWAGQGGGGVGNSPFAFLLEFPKATIFDVAFGGIIVAVALRRHSGDRNAWPLLAGIGTMFLAASGAALLLDLPTSSAFYFLNVGLVASLCLLPLLGPLPDRFNSLGLNRRRTILLAVVLGLMFVNDYTWKAPQALAKTFSRLSKGTQAGITESLLHNSPYGQIFTRINSLPSIDGVFVDPGNEAFWKGDRTCWASSLIIPALTGVPMLMGYPPPQQGCDVTKYYGFGYYSAARSAPVPDATRSELCRAAKQRDMTRILRVGPKGEEDVIDCTAKGISADS